MAVDTSIYTNVWNRLGEYPGLTLYMFVGQRGDGKTYSTLKPFATGEKTDKFVYVRKTDSTLDSACSEELNPFKNINATLGTKISMHKLKKFTVITNEHEDGTVEQIGYGVALTTFGRIKGADFSDCNYIIFDEFMEQGNRRVMRDEAFSLFQLYETVNRNREFEGKKKVVMILLGNSEGIDNDVIRYFRIAEEIHQMKVNGENFYVDRDKGLYFELIPGGRFAEKKRETALYKLTKGGSFYEFALNNEFTQDYFGDVGSLPFNELEPIVGCCGIFFYRSKATRLIYACKRKANCKKYNQQQIKGFKRDYGFMLMNAEERGYLRYSDYDIKLEVSHLICDN